MSDKKDILKVLKDFGRLSSSRLYAMVGMNKIKGDRLLNELLLNNEVTKQEETLATYWELKKH